MEVELRNNSQEIYKAKAFIQRNYIVFEIKSDSENYSKQFTLEQLSNLNRYFKQAEKLEDALDLLKDLFEENYSIEKQEETIEFIINYKKREIKFILDIVKEEENLLYDSLVDGFKKIIDNNELILGIDLGTTYSSAAVMIGDNIVMIRNSLGLTTTPSYIHFLSKNEVYVGELAKLLPPDEKNIVFNVKRLLGKNIEDKTIKDMRVKLPFNLKKDDKFNSLKIELNFGKEGKEELYPEQICALILKKIVNDSEFYISKKIGKDTKINNVVITVPAYFNQKQREATLNSAKIIGLNVKTMINEPTAASLAYAYKSLENTDKNIIVIDFGGGTLDITLLRFRKDENAVYCDVKFTYGNTNFGGEDFDNILMSKCLKQCNDISKSLSLDDNSKKKPHYLRLKRAFERAKIKLSSFDSTNIHIQNKDYKNIDFQIKREDFIEYCKERFEQFEKILNDFISQSKIEIKDIAEVILTGGSTLIPKIREIISKKFICSQIKDDLDPKEVVAMGASIRGAKCFYFSSVKDIKLFDVTNLSLGIKLINNKFEKLIPRSTPIPFHNEGTFETVYDNQDYAQIEVFEGEEEDDCDKNNLFLGKFKIYGLPKRKKGESKFEVRLEMKENLILEVTAKDYSNKSNQTNLKIDKLNDFPKIIDELKKRQNCILFFENEDYNKIKFSIMESEDEIRKQKRKKKLDIESIKSNYKNIIEKIGHILLNYNEFSNIYISFIKYYFSKICEFYLVYNLDNKKELKYIKKYISKIFEKIRINERRDIIFEIIEESIDEDNIYKSFNDLIIQSLYDDINTIYFMSKEAIKESNTDILKNALKDFSKAKSHIDICIYLINKFDINKNKLNNITKNDLDIIKLKIEVREVIIKKKNKSIFKELFDHKHHDEKLLKELYNKYLDFPSVDFEDLQELGKIIGIDQQQENLRTSENNFDTEWKKAEIFMNWIKEINKDNDVLSTIHHILENYPYTKKTKEKKEMWNDFYKFKAQEYTKDEYLFKLKGKYEIASTSDIESQVFTAIKEYFNLLLV